MDATDRGADARRRRRAGVLPTRRWGHGLPATMARMSRTPSRPQDISSESTEGVSDISPDRVADAFVAEAAEERQHLLRDGVISIGLGLLTPSFLYLALAILLNYPRRRFGLSGEASTVLIVAIVVVFGAMLVWSWFQVRPFAQRDSRSSDPRYGRPKVRANEADDETTDGFYDSDGADLTWSVLYSGPIWFEMLLTLGSRQVMQGMRSLIERSRLNRSRLTLAATLLIRAGRSGGLSSPSIPDDAATLDAMTFLWRHRYLKSEGVLSRTRIRPNDKGARVLAGEFEQ